MTWNRFGTPHAVAPRSGNLATGLSSDNTTAARQWISRNLALLGIGAAAARDLEVVTATGHSVLLRQRFGGLPAGIDGTVGVAVVDGRVAHVWSSLTRDTTLTGERRLSAEEAVSAATADVGPQVDPAEMEATPDDGEWTVLDVEGVTEPARARLVAVPTPLDGVRPAWETLTLQPADAAGYSHLIDAETGDVLVRTDLVDQAQADEGNPEWDVFPNTPPMDYSSTDTRDRWCWTVAPDCEEVVANPASPRPGTSTSPPARRPSPRAATTRRSTEKWQRPA